MTANHSWTGDVAVLGLKQEADAAVAVSSSRIISIMMAQKLFKKRMRGFMQSQQSLDYLVLAP